MTHTVSVHEVTEKFKHQTWVSRSRRHLALFLQLAVSPPDDSFHTQRHLQVITFDSN